MPDHEAGELKIEINVSGNKSTNSIKAYYVLAKKVFEEYGIIPEKDKTTCFDFAYDMSYGHDGKHRDHRTGGNLHRTAGQIFIDTFQGKMAEYALYRYFQSKNIELNKPDVERFGLGKWDSFDLECQGKHLSVKSTKFFGNLLLLETKDWDNNGNYIPNLDNGTAHYDYTFLVRFKPDGESIMKENHLLYQRGNNIPNNIHELLVDKVKNRRWSYDFPGFIYYSELVKMIREKRIIPQGAYLNGKTPMDAENYYFQVGNMHSIDETYLINENDEVNRNNVRLRRTCPWCGKTLTVRHSIYGPFWGCTGYPNCTFKENIKQPTQSTM